MQLTRYGEFPKDLPVIVDEDMLLYPFMIAPLFISNEDNLKAIDLAMEGKDKLIFIAPSKSNDEDTLDFYDIGVIGTIMRRVALPEGRIKILFQGLSRGSILQIKSTNPNIASVAPIISLPYDAVRIEAILAVLKENLRTLYSISQHFPQDLLKSINETSDPNRAADLISSAIRLKKDQAYKIFKEENPEERLLSLIEITMEEIRAQQIQKEIKNKVNSQMEKANKEYFLKEQLKQIQKELGGDSKKDSEIEEYRQKLESLKSAMPKDAYKEVQKQINKLSRMHQDSADANLLQNYLEVVLEIPFNAYAKKDLEISEVEKQLSKDHYALEKPKERILEYFAVRKLLEIRKTKAESHLDSTEAKGTILCFYGPPGVGKTSLANSIATALKRKLVRIALGGLEDVSELRGHRRTYIGAMPGRIVQGLIEAKEMNPVVVLDEIDKIRNSFRGDPSSVLLEILDPEQNKEFRDYYTNFDLDLSQVIFVATANDISAIPAPLRDRMEFININSYTPNQKEQIAKKYLIPQELKKHGLLVSEVSFSPSAIKMLIEKYTREAGVRSLRRKIAEILRKVSKQILQSAQKNVESKNTKKISITPKTLPSYLDKIVFEFENVSKNAEVGLVNGLAWTSVGGDVLKIEALKIRGKGSLHLTGNLGDVMKESAKIAHSYVKFLIDTGVLKINPKLIPLTPKEKEEHLEPSPSEIYNRFDIHLHVPEGATPKDGPSAGIAIASALASLLTNKKARCDVAMTGELTLRGKVLPIGGLQEKLIAAYKSGIQEVLIPKKNFERDLNEIPQEVRDGLKIHPISDFKEVLAVILR
ncbi:endopeptidase La [Helicobacter turcicus]|uniref:Lon protease n=1 Tax=Helicobacter turcicus TaxID=2867412 RepID=A0ABS7JNY7_9HELI|nr:endopeptidase La [Helicobacter turcicus]MBX7491126.1 endopeptidase La [Helicobacter turcicus]MBX7545990.1 endopeptidase La [Helicobacter turcicus]